MKPPNIQQPDKLVLVLDEQVHIVTKSHPNFQKIKEAMDNEEWETIPHLFSISETLKRFLGDEEGFYIKNNTLYYKGEPVNRFLSRRLMELYVGGQLVTPLIEFLKNLYQNPSRKCIEHLYEFLETKNMPITHDGHFLAYKVVNKDYKDMHTNTIFNGVGEIVSMPKSQVDSNPENTCSRGLHFCSKEYLKHFKGDRLLVLKINPAHVVAIPNDYGGTKGRCYRYEVIEEIPYTLDPSRLDTPY